MSAIASAPGAVAQRYGKKLYLPRFASLPPNCVKCGQAAKKPYRKKFYWHAPWLYILIVFPGLLIYAIVALIVRKSIELDVPLCDYHHGSIRQKRLIGAILLLGCIPGGMVMNMALGFSEGTAWLAGVVAFIAGLVFFSVAGSVMAPKKIDDAHAEFGGVAAEFLQFLPERPA